MPSHHGATRKERIIGPYAHRRACLSPVGVPAQACKFVESKPCTNRNVCFGSGNKRLAAPETFVSRCRTNLSRG